MSNYQNEMIQLENIKYLGISNICTTVNSFADCTDNDKQFEEVSEILLIVNNNNK